MKLLPILYSVLLVGVLCPVTHAQLAKYILKRQNLNHDKGCLLRLYERRTHNLIWKLTVEDVYHEPVWSADHQAFALLVNPNRAENAKLLVWQVGSSPHSLPTGSSATGYLFQDWDGILNIWWAPNKKRILMRAFYSGMGEGDSGQLLCYVLDKKRFYEGPKGIRRARWIGPQRVRYWKTTAPANNEGLPGEARHSQVWYCP